MAVLWIQSSETGVWEARPLVSQGSAGIECGPVRVMQGWGAGAQPPAEICGVETDAGQRWVLLAAPPLSILVNGKRLLPGIRSLRERDELLIAGERVYFSAEERAEVVPFEAPNGQSGFRCARCRGVIEAGSLAVRCTGCGAWHHQDEKGDRPCWTYGATCAACSQSSQSGQEPNWSPETL